MNLLCVWVVGWGVELCRGVGPGGSWCCVMFQQGCVCSSLGLLGGVCVMFRVGVGVQRSYNKTARREEGADFPHTCIYRVCGLTDSLPSLTYTHTHTHTYIYIYV